jgi:hypothetical protein
MPAVRKNNPIRKSLLIPKINAAALGRELAPLTPLLKKLAHHKIAFIVDTSGLKAVRTRAER